MRESTANVGLRSGRDGAFEAIVDAETIQTAISFVETLFDECHVYLNEDEIRLSAIDPATVAAVDLSLDRSAFESYDAAGTHVGVNVERLRDVLAMADRGQLVALALDTERRVLEIRIDGLEYTLALLDPESIRAPPEQLNSELDLPGEIVVSADDFSRAIRAANMVSTHISLGIDASVQTFEVEATGDTDDVSLSLASDDLLNWTFADARSLFSLDYLSAIDRAMPGDAAIELRLGTEQPAIVTIDFATESGSVEYLLAPRISTQ